MIQCRKIVNLNLSGNTKLNAVEGYKDRVLASCPQGAYSLSRSLSRARARSLSPRLGCLCQSCVMCLCSHLDLYLFLYMHFYLQMCMYKLVAGIWRQGLHATHTHAITYACTRTHACTHARTRAPTRTHTVMILDNKKVAEGEAAQSKKRFSLSVPPSPFLSLSFSLSRCFSLPLSLSPSLSFSLSLCLLYRCMQVEWLDCGRWERNFVCLFDCRKFVLLLRHTHAHTHTYSGLCMLITCTCAQATQVE